MREVKRSSFADDMRLYVENPIETKSYWNVKSDFSKDMRYEINVQKINCISVYFQ